MMIFIIGVVFVLVAIASLVVFKFKNNQDKYGDHDGWLFGFWANMLVGVCTLICVGVCALVFNSPRAHKEARIQYNIRVEELINTRCAVLQIRDDYSRSVAINEYNTKVREFKEDILTTQVRLDNIWINWFNNYEYKNFDANIVSYISEVN